MKKYTDKIILFFKWFAMWTCDVIPWVSWGTIAFIVWIYDKLIAEIKSFDLDFFKNFFTGKWKEIKIDLIFLITLFGWIIFAILLLSNLIHYLLETQESKLFAFFFWLILASAIIIIKKISKIKRQYILFWLLWFVIAYILTWSNSIETPNNLLTIFFSWFIAITAMILPWISWSYILLILWKYSYVIELISWLTKWNFSNILPIIFFVLWAFLWIILFSKLLHFLLKKYYNYMIFILTWFMLWSLNKLRPWKEITWNITNSHGEVISSISQNVLPNSLSNLFVWIGFMMLWFGILMFLEYKLIKKTK